MTAHDDRLTAQDIEAFVLGHLDPAERLALARNLATKPHLAAEALSESARIDGLRLALGTLDTPPAPALTKAAARLDLRLRNRRWFARAGALAAGLAMFGLGWWAQTLMPQSPDWPDLALAEAAYLAYDLGQPTPDRDPLTAQELASTAAQTGFDLPDLPPQWQVLDLLSQNVGNSPGLVLHLATPEMGDVILLVAGAPGGQSDRAPQGFTQGVAAGAVFEVADTAYVLFDRSGHPDDVSRNARLLQNRWQ
jgi:hypothetical protein